jgi:hypothetical protein
VNQNAVNNSTDHIGSMRIKLFIVLSIFFVCAFTYLPNGGDKKLNKKLDDDSSKYTNVGEIGLTVTNFGMYGNGFALWPQQPSCEYPLGSGIEHIFDGSLWVGGFISSDSLNHNRVGPFVTTGSVDASSVAQRGGGFEFTNAPGSKIVEKSSLLDSRYYDPTAVSHQDFIMDYSDTSLTLSNGETIQDHNPLGIAVHQECYAWDYPFADFFVIMNYTIKNVSKKYIDSVYVGLWTDAVVRNTKITSPRTGASFFNKGGEGYSDSMKMAYTYDANGDIGYTNSYVGIQFLGSTPTLDSIFVTGTDTLSSVNFVSWQYKNTTDPNFFSPTNDIDRYRKMEGYFGGTNRYGKQYGIDPASLKTPSNRSELITHGPFRSLAPGQSINVVFAIVCAKKYGNDPMSLDSPAQKINLYSNGEWALRAYYGEDRNRNGILDPGEDLDGNGKITRYILPAPPRTPAVKVVPGNQSVSIYWDKRSESSVDPISGKKDFEGYRLYRTEAGFDLNLAQDARSSLVMLAQFDSAGNSIGFNTGFSKVRLKNPVTFPGDTTKYYYRFDVDSLLNGWQYLFSVTAFDKGDPSNNLESLESSPLSSLGRILPGTLPNNNDKAKVGVYPNPYYGNAYWDGSTERLRKIYFYNLPSECTITIYTLSGDIVKRIYHHQNSNGSDIKWFQTYASGGKQVMTGGEDAWDLLTDNDQAIATGLYLYTVKDTHTGEIMRGKFLVIK